MAIKAVNNTAGSNSLVPTLLVFGAYSCIHVLDPLTLSIFQLAVNIKKPMEKVREFYVEKQVADAFNT